MKIIFLAGVCLLGIGAFSVWRERMIAPVGRVPMMQEMAPEVAVESPLPVVSDTLPVAEVVDEEPLPQMVLIPGVPFTVQAPLAQWSDPMFQDACEEASIIMAEAWVNGVTLTKDGVTEEIQILEKFEKKQFGQAIDTSIADTAWLSDQYYGVMGEVHTGITVTDMKRALAMNKIVIVPTDGRKLKNPNFKQPGPTRHMLVIVGYDSVTKEFIVNDPGTRLGKSYRYPEAVLYDAILDYPTGDHLPVTSTDKVMLMVSRD